MYIASRITCRCLYLFVLIGFASNAVAQESAKVYLSNSSGERHQIGDLITSDSAQGTEFQFALQKQTFGDYFLSMRPFKCLESDGRMLCYLPYPYEKPTVFSDTEMRPLEYDVLFIHRQKKDYGIDPWNGLYYKLDWKEGVLQGQAHAVDLNVLASPPENGVIFPLSDGDLHEIESEQAWLPMLEVVGLDQKSN